MIEALKTLVSALEKADKISGHPNNAKAIKVGRQAIEQAEQAQPVAWKHACAALLINELELWIDACPHCGKPRTTPPQRKLLTDDEVMRVAIECQLITTGNRQGVYASALLDFALRIIEASSSKEKA